MNIREYAHFLRDPALENLELLHANYVTHTFAPHIHEGFAIGVVEQGVETFRYRHAVHFASAGEIVLINPGEMHTGSAAVKQGWTYRMLYPSASLLQRAASEIVGHQHDIPFFVEPVVADPVIAVQIAMLHATFTENTSALERESQLLWILAQLIIRHTDSRPVPSKIAKEYGSVQRIRTYIENHYAENISLESLAHLVHLSPFHLLRTFRNIVGMPPHAYLTQTRINHARRLLLVGIPLAEVALLVGFADQSHFTKHFKRVVGIPPGLYAQNSKSSKIRQDSAHRLI